MKEEATPNDQTADPSKEAELSNEELDDVSGGLMHSGAGTEHDEVVKVAPVYDGPGRPLGNSYPSPSGGTKA